MSGPRWELRFTTFIPWPVVPDLFDNGACMNGKYMKFPKDVSGLVLIAAGMFFLFAIAVEFLETSLVLFSIFIVYLAYCWRVLPEIDRRIEKTKGGGTDAENTRPGAEQRDSFERLKSSPLREVLTFLSITVISFLVLHLFVLMMHEFSHSFLAYFLGAKQDPWDIVYGNWIGAHWDENVEYSVQFAAGKGATAAAIAFAGPLSNIVLFFITAGLMSARTVKKHRWAYHCVFWTCVITFVMVFEYVFTRSFLKYDDFGNITHGLGISPWPIFLAGTILGIIGLYYLLTYKLPEYYPIVALHRRPLEYIAVSAVSFVIFLFYIGLRITAYPVIPEWWCGVAGIAALFIVPVAAGPAREWVKERMKKSGQRGG